ncbi:uncharacterized protein NPIL_524891 [Nephila pilipes]|uniref:Uncharacterized protein n=1 Tax=Nephila pilipes TaxID=299642 RepID=A0A8X6TJV2_NEPPI|nr:uncharacterized protein NPIL_524891 [Nephila pilipes]
MLLLSSSVKIFSLGCVVLICLACIPGSSSDEFSINTLRKISQEFSEGIRWMLSPVGKIGAEVVALFLSSSTSRTLNETLKSGAKDQFEFLFNTVKILFENELALSIIVGIGILISILMMFFPCIIIFCRLRQKAKLNDSEDGTYYESNQEGWCLFEVFFICSAVAICGVAIVGFGCVRAHMVLQVPFKFASFAVEGAYKLKLQLQVSHQTRLNDVSRSAFDVIMLLNNVNEDLGNDYMHQLHNVIRPIANIATSIQWELLKVSDILKSQSQLLKEFLSNASSDIKDFVDKFNSSVDEIKNAYKTEGISSAVLSPLLNLPSLNLSSDAPKSYTKPIKILMNASEIDVQDGIRELNDQIRALVLETKYDPSSITESLKNVSFQIQKNLDESTAKYMIFINEYMSEEDRKEIIDTIQRAENKTVNASLILLIIVVFLDCIAFILAVALVVTYALGICGTYGFQTVQEGNRISLRKTSLSHHSGRALIVFCYITSLFLWLYWLSTAFYFFITSVPIVGCQAMNDLSILDMTIDDVRYRARPGWYSLFTSEKFNMTLKQTVTECQNDTSFVPTLPDPLVNISEASKIKSMLNFTSVVEKFNEGTQNISVRGFSSFKYINSALVKSLNEIDINPPFDNLERFLSNLTKRNASETFSKIRRDSGKIPDVVKLANASELIYVSLISEASRSLAMRNSFLNSLDGVNISVNTAVMHASYLNWTADALFEVVLNESVRLFNKTLYKTMSKLIDGIFVEMQLAALDFRRSMSLCEVIMMFYEKGAVIMCNVVLYPFAVSWIGLLLLSVFLTLAVAIVVKSHRYFIRFTPDAGEKEDNE